MVSGSKAVFDYNDGILSKDKNEQLFVSLYSGRIKSMFNDIETYIKYIKTFDQIDHKYLIDIICHINNINIIVFNRKYSVIQVDNENVKK